MNSGEEHRPARNPAPRSPRCPAGTVDALLGKFCIRRGLLVLSSDLDLRRIADRLLRLGNLEAATAS